MKFKIDKNLEKVDNLYEQVALYRVHLKGNAPDLFVKIYKTASGKYFPVPNYWIGLMTPYAFNPNEHDTPEEAFQEMINRGLDFYDDAVPFEQLKIMRNTYYYMDSIINEHLVKNENQ